MRLAAIVLLTIILLPIGGTADSIGVRQQMEKAPAGQGAEHNLTDEELSTLYFLFLVRGPKWSAEQTPQSEEIQKGHLAHLTQLGQEGKGLMGGPFEDAGDLRGILVVTAGSIEEAMALEESDPAVKAGRLAIEAHPWMTARKRIKTPDTPIQMTTYFIGILESAAKQPALSRGDSPALQDQHLANINDQARSGKLVLAGPFLDGGARKGILIYKVPSAEEAKSLAESDPAVKAGVLKVSVFKWWTAKGVLP